MVNSDSMINPAIVDLLEKFDTRYSLVVATSKRARQIIGGDDILIRTNSKKPLTIAINEVDKDLVNEVSDLSDVTE